MKKLLLTLALLSAFLFGAAAPTHLLNPRLFSGTVLEATYTPTPIKSLTPLSVSVAAATSNTGSWSGTAAAATLVFQGNDTSGASGFVSYVDDVQGTITNGTTITVTRGSATTAGTTVWNGVVVEFLAQFVKSQGCGSIAIANAASSNTATITAVNTAKTLVSYTGQTNAYTTSSAAGSNEVRSKVTLTNATTITASRSGTSANLVGLATGYCYVEFK